MPNILELPDAQKAAARGEGSDAAVGGQVALFIRRLDLFAMMAVSKATGERLLAAGRIGPRPIRIGSQTLRFERVEVLFWLRNRRPDGQLHDRKTWPSIWEGLKKSQPLSRG